MCSTLIGSAGLTMTPEEACRIRKIWDEYERLGALRGGPWAKIKTVAPAVLAEIGLISRRSC
jgi:hypothetical protein